MSKKKQDGITFYVEVIGPDTMQVIIEDCPEKGLNTALTGTPVHFLGLAQLIQRKAVIGYYAGSA